MPSHPLPNYLRMHRKRSGFSQDEVAFLLGVKSGAKVCRYERRRRVPPLETALAYEVIFRIPVRKLFLGTYEEVERRVVKRAEHLARRLINTEPSRMTERKAEVLRAIYFGSHEEDSPNS